MKSVLDKVDQRTKLVGQNRLELLTFFLNGSQMFAINVFKVQEVLTLPELNVLPSSHPAIVGVMHNRGRTLPVVDLSYAIGRSMIREDDDRNVIVTEYNQSTQAFLIGRVSHIVNMNWDEIMPPPKASGRTHYLTAITQINEKICEIIDVERVLADITPYTTDVSEDVLDTNVVDQARGMTILAVDDSPVALRQIKATIAHLGINVVTESDGKKALEKLRSWVAEGENVPEKLLMVITDAEMPEMDGYMLTTHIRDDPNLKDLFVMMHTSLSGSFNNAMVQQVGCDGFLSKFNPDGLATAVQNRVRQKLGLDPVEN